MQACSFPSPLKLPRYRFIILARVMYRLNCVFLSVIFCDYISLCLACSPIVFNFSQLLSTFLSRKPWERFALLLPTISWRRSRRSFSILLLAGISAAHSSDGTVGRGSRHTANRREWTLSGRSAPFVVCVCVFKLQCRLLLRPAVQRAFLSSIPIGISSATAPCSGRVR